MPQVPRRSAPEVARQPYGRTAARSLLPRGLHAAASAGTVGAAKRTSPLRHSVPGCIGNLAGSRRRSEAPRCGHRFLTVLHTWGQNLSHHPHIHCVVPGGGLSSDRSRWIGSGDRFLLPLGVSEPGLSRKVSGLPAQSGSTRQAPVPRCSTELATPRGFGRLLKKAYGCEWVVYTKPRQPPEHVLRYLARYTHRVAISNHRIVSIADGQVTFLWKDYARWKPSR